LSKTPVNFVTLLAAPDDGTPSRRYDPVPVEAEEALLLLVGAAAGGLASTAALVALGLRTLRRRNRVSPAVRTPVPVGWLWSPRACPRMHRRLRRVVDGSRAWVELSPPAWSVLSDAAADIEARAVVLDGQLPALDRSPVAVRRRMLRELTIEVIVLEAQVERIMRLARDARAPTLSPGDGGLDALEQAVRELTEVSSP
jgi:hypothetical protein